MTDLKVTRAAGWIPELTTFGARLALLRQAMGWGNVKQAATLCSIPVESWRGWERDGLEPRQLIHQCMKIAGVTGVDYRWLALGPVGERDEATSRYQVADTRVVAIGSDERRLQSESVRRIVRARPMNFARSVQGAAV